MEIVPGSPQTSSDEIPEDESSIESHLPSLVHSYEKMADLLPTLPSIVEDGSNMGPHFKVFSTINCMRLLKGGSEKLTKQSLSSNKCHFASDIHVSSVFKVFDEMRIGSQLCDVTINAGNIYMNAHRVVLAACSPYFKAMFTGNCLESKQETVTLHDMDPKAIQHIIDYFYTGNIVIERQNVQSLLPAACFLQLSDIQEVCCEFIKAHLDSNNCLAILSMSETLSCNDLYKTAEKYALLNFDHLLSSDDLHVKNEEYVYCALMKWLHFDLTNRKNHLPKLLEHVRMPLLNRKFLVGTVSSESLIRSNTRCRDLVDEAKNVLLLPEEKSFYHNVRTRPRNHLTSGKFVFSIGGWCSGDVLASVERYDVETKDWQLVQPMNTARCGMGTAVIGNYLFAINGFDGHRYLNTSERYNVYLNTWSTDVANTAARRTSGGVAVMNNCIYALGGQDGGKRIDIVEQYDPTLNVWHEVSKMRFPRLGFGTVVLNNNMLYAIGGSNGSTSVADGEQYDHRSGKWYKICDMHHSRKHLGLTVINNKICAVGGRNELEELSSAEIFDPRANAWTSIVPMISKRSGVGLTAIHDKLTAIGGFDGKNYLKSAEQYDALSNEWVLLPNMNSKRLGGGVEIVKLDVTDSITTTLPETQVMNRLDEYHSDENSISEIQE